MGIPLYLIYCFFLVVLVFSPCLYVHLINMGLSMLDLGLSYIGLSAFPGLESVSFPMLGKFLTIIYFLRLSSPHPHFLDPYNANIVVFNIFPEVSDVLFSLFSLLCSTAVISTILSSRWLTHSLASFTLMLIPSSIFFHFRDCIVLLLLFVL